MARFGAWSRSCGGPGVPGGGAGAHLPDGTGTTGAEPSGAVALGLPMVELATSEREVARDELPRGVAQAGAPPADRAAAAAPRGPVRAPSAHHAWLADTAVIACALKDLGSVELVPVRGGQSPESRLWKAMIAGHHYAGYQRWWGRSCAT